MTATQPHFCIGGDSDGKKILGIPRAVKKIRLRLRIDEPDRIYLKYANFIEEHYLEIVDDNHVRVHADVNAKNADVNAKNTTKDIAQDKKKNFWKV